VISKGDLLPQGGVLEGGGAVSAEVASAAEKLPTRELVAPPEGSVFYVQDQDSLNAAYERACRELPDALRVSTIL
jgi:hypothetical protein